MKKSKSLKFKLVLLSAGIALSLGALTLGTGLYFKELKKSEVEKAFGAFADGLSDAIAAQFFERYGDVQAFSINPDIKSSDRNTIVTALNEYVKLYGIYDLIMVVDKNGKLVAANNKGPSSNEIDTKFLYTKDYSKEPWFTSVMSGKYTSDAERGFDGTYVEDMQVDKYTTELFGKKTLGNSFSAAIHNQKGEVIGVITNRADSRWIEVSFKELMESLKGRGFQDTELTLLGKTGVVLYEYAPYFWTKTNHMSKDGEKDFDTLLKFNLAATGHHAAVAAVAGKKGHTIVMHKRRKVNQVAGYHFMNNPKFVPSIGWSVMARIDEDEAFAKVNTIYMYLSIISAFFILISGLIGYWFSSKLSNSIKKLSESLADSSNQVASASIQISDSSTELSEATTEQASAIQETAASIDEVSAMVKKTADNAKQSQDASTTSRNSAQTGQQAIEEMMSAMDEINHSTNNIMEQVMDSNKQIEEIVKVISEIGSKTKVINDIVFQTKLLSFNASVEAARAGEHGKGFAVVAEEVGNLAQMSGNAAKEISELLDSSMKKVENIVEETKSKVEVLVEDSKKRVESGTDVAKKCSDALNQILESVQNVDIMVGEISTASQEQSTGVSEINKAINQLDQATQQSSSVAQSAASAASQLSGQAEALKSLVSELVYVINGTTEEGSDYFDHNKKQKTGKKGDVIQFPKKETKSSSEEKYDLAAGAEGMSAKSVGSKTPERKDPRFKEI